MLSTLSDSIPQFRKKSNIEFHPPLHSAAIFNAFLFLLDTFRIHVYNKFTYQELEGIFYVFICVILIFQTPIGQMLLQTVLFSCSEIIYTDDSKDILYIDSLSGFLCTNGSSIGYRCM